MIKYPSSGTYPMTSLLITSINSCPQLKTRASRWQDFCSSPSNTEYLWGALITLIPGDNHKDLPTDFTVSWLCLSHGPWVYILAAQFISTTEWQLFETVTKSPFFLNSPTSFTTCFLSPNLELSIQRDCCPGRLCWWLNFSAHVPAEGGCRLHSSAQLIPMVCLAGSCLFSVSLTLPLALAHCII